MRHHPRPINSQGWSVAAIFVIGVLLLWAIAFWVHRTRYHSHRDVTVVSVAPAMDQLGRLSA